MKVDGTNRPSAFMQYWCSQGNVTCIFKALTYLVRLCNIGVVKAMQRAYLRHVTDLVLLCNIGVVNAT